MREMTCITCPNGCTLSVEEKDGRIVVTGNQCPKGEAFAKSELTNPMRTISTTVSTRDPAVPVVPVRVSGEIPKGRITTPLFVATTRAGSIFRKEPDGTTNRSDAGVGCRCGCRCL